jgi:hypothetical protein
MQKKKKIQKNKELREGVRSKTDDSYQQRFDAILQSARKLETPEESTNEIFVKHSGSFALLPQLELVRGWLDRGESLTIRGDLKSAEKTVRLIELVKDTLGVSGERVRGSIDKDCFVCFTIS